MPMVHPRLLERGSEGRLCGTGLSRLMLVQRNFPTRDYQISQPDAAAQHGVPKAAIELVQIGRKSKPVVRCAGAGYIICGAS